MRPTLRALAMAVSASGLHAQQIRVTENAVVTRGLEQRPLVEPHLVAHPTNAGHLLGATIVSNVTATFDSTSFCATVVSMDGGTTWERHDFPITGCGDPWVAILPDGRAIFAALGGHRALPQQRSGLVTFRSPDGGRTWDPNPVGLGRAHDHQTIAVDFSSKRKGWMYLVSGQGVRADEGKLRWSVYVARSRNGGQSFDEPHKTTPSNLNINAELPAVLSDGTLIVSFRDFQTNVNDFRSGGHLERARVWVLRSTDGGHSFSIPLFASEGCASGWSTLVADTAASSAFRDRVYLACRGRPGGAIVANYSANGGETWTEPARVHTAPVDTSIVRATPAMAVNASGVLGISWIDGRIARGCHQVYFTASLDGGKTFLPEQPISGVRSCPDSAASGAAFTRWKTGGDYFGMTAAADGRFHVLWADSRGGPFQLRSAVIDVSRR